MSLAGTSVVAATSIVVIPLGTVNVNGGPQAGELYSPENVKTVGVSAPADPVSNSASGTARAAAVASKSPIRSLISTPP